MTALDACTGRHQVVRRHPVLRRGRPATCRRGTLTAVLGPSGCGKTTLLRLVAGFARPRRRHHRARRPRSSPAPAGRVPPQRRQVGYVPQEGALFPHLDVAANIAFGLPRAQRRARGRVGELLELVGLPASLRRPLPARALRRPAAAGRAGPGAGAAARRSCCSTSRSPRSTPRCASEHRPGGRPARCARPARPRCWSPTTRPRRCRWPTRSR